MMIDVVKSSDKVEQVSINTINTWHLFGHVLWITNNWPVQFLLTVNLSSQSGTGTSEGGPLFNSNC